MDQLTEAANLYEQKRRNQDLRSTRVRSLSTEESKKGILDSTSMSGRTHNYVVVMFVLRSNTSYLGEESDCAGGARGVRLD